MVKEVDYIIKRTDVKANLDTLYLFGDNTDRVGMGGQAKEMRGEPNSIGICTKRAPNNQPWAFMSDDYLNKNKIIISGDIDRAIKKYISGGYKHIVIPPMGVGLAKLPEKAPLTYAYLREQIEFLKEAINALTN